MLLQYSVWHRNRDDCDHGGTGRVRCICPVRCVSSELHGLAKKQVSGVNPVVCACIDYYYIAACRVELIWLHKNGC